jgi:hypothetical protein
LERLNALEPAPEYVTDQEFESFVLEQEITVNPKYGYVCVHTYRPFYFPGEVVRGSIFLDFFNDLPNNYKKVMIRLTGQEYVNKHHERVKSAIKR